MSENRQIINLMPQNEALVVPEMGYICERVEVYWDIEHGDVYQLGSKKVNGRWEKMYQPAKQGLDKLQIGGGIETLDQDVQQIPDKWIWNGKWSGTYTTPTGISIPLKEDYSYDMTIGGPRWAKRKDSEIDSLVTKNTPELQAKNYPSKDEIADAWAAMPKEKREEIEARAENVATKFCVEGAQFGAQRAVTGARLRALRTYFEIRQYTESEVRNSHFVIYRTRIDHEAMKEIVGETGARLLSFAQVLKGAGIDDPKEIEALSRVLIEAETSKKEWKTIQLQEDDVDEDPYLLPLTKVTLNGIRGKIVRLVPSLAPLSDRKLAPALGKFLDREYTDETKLREAMNEGEGLSVLKFYSLLSEEGTDNKDDWKRSCIRYIEEGVVWDGTILPEPEPELIDPAE